MSSQYSLVFMNVVGQVKNEISRNQYLTTRQPLFLTKILDNLRDLPSATFRTGNSKSLILPPSAGVKN